MKDATMTIDIESVVSLQYGLVIFQGEFPFFEYKGVGGILYG